MKKSFRTVFFIGILMMVSAIAFAKSYPAPITSLPNETGKSFVKIYESRFEEYYKFINLRYAFTVDFPQAFTKAFFPENGDGARFELPDGSAGMTAFGGHNIDESTLEEYYLRSLNGVKGEVGYTEKGNGWFVITWSENGKIYYWKQFVSEKYQNGCQIWYPEEQKANYDEVVRNIESSFTPGWLTGYKIWG